MSSNLVHLVTLACRDAAHAEQCLAALAGSGRSDALEYGCRSYDFGLRDGTDDVVRIVERWERWDDLDALLADRVVPALPVYNQLLARPFDPAIDTERIVLGLPDEPVDAIRHRTYSAD
jgi:quinol monooxygenase YgiN